MKPGQVADAMVAVFLGITGCALLVHWWAA